MAGGITLSYSKALDVLTVAYTRQFAQLHGKRYAEERARELARELLRPALSDAARERLDAMGELPEPKRNGRVKLVA